MNLWPWRRPKKQPRPISEQGRHVVEAHRLRRKYGPAFDDIRAVFLGLDAGRVHALLDDYEAAYGVGPRRYAKTTYGKWQRGEVLMGGQTVARLLDLLPRHMTPDEKLALLQALRAQTLARLGRSRVRLAVSRRSDLGAVVRRVLALMPRPADIELPPDFHEVQGWIALQDAQALSKLAEQTEQFVAAQRLADLIVHLSIVARLSALAGAGWRVRVQTQFAVPTADVKVVFKSSFWRKESADAMPESDEQFLVRLQELALRQEREDGSLSFVEYVMRTLTPEEQATLRALAAQEGLKAEILLRELQVKTIAARGDIEATIATAEELKARKHAGKVTSEHATASGTTKIEIETKSRPCYIATACYGDGDHPDVRALRAWRDTRLLPTAPGRLLARLYDLGSPPLARRLGPNAPLSRFLRRCMLGPLARRLRDNKD